MAELVRKRMGEVWWELSPRMKDEFLPLLEQIGKPPPGWFHGPGEGREKRILRHDPGGPVTFTMKSNRPGLATELFVKRYKVWGLQKFWGSGVFESAVGRQWRMAEEHGRRGLPIAGHLARGKRRRWMLGVEEYLVQESLTSYEPFEEFFRTTFLPELPGVLPRDKRRVIQQLSGLIRKMHDNGISRPRIEPGNIMAAARSGGGVNLVFVDLAKSCLPKDGKAFCIEERVLELARFHKSFSPLFSQGYRLRFYRNYFFKDDLQRPEFQELVKRIVTYSVDLSRRDEPDIKRRVMKRKDPFFWFQAGPRRVFMRKPLYQNSILEMLDKIDGTKDRGKIRIKGVGTPVRELLVIKAIPGHDLPRKESSAARWAFIASAIMDHHGVSHYRVMAAIERNKDRNGHILALMPGKGEYSLAEYLARRVADEFSGISWDRRFLVRVARFILVLHELEWHFPKPAGDDIWVRHTEADTHDLKIFNLMGLRKMRPENPERQLKNLFELAAVLPISPADATMLAQEYIRFSRTLADNQKGWLKRFREWQLENVKRTNE